MGGAVLSKSLTQISVDKQGCVPSLLFDLRPNYGGGNEDNGDLLQKVPCMHCCTAYPQPCSRPPPTHASAGDSWTLTGKSVSVSFRVTGPFSWVLVHTRFCLCSPRVCFPSPVKFWWLRAYAIPRSAVPRAPASEAGHCWLYLCRRHSNTVLAQSLWGLWVLVHTRFVWTLWVSLAGMGFDSKCSFAPLTVFLGLLLCPWTWGIFLWWDPTFSSRWLFSSEL